MQHRRIPELVLATMLLAVLPRALAAQQLDVIRGQVTNAEQQPVENASVTATSVSGGVNRTTRTDRSGRFTITFPGGEGDYYVSFASIGYAPRRFEVKRTADQEILVADAQLQRMTMLDTLKATATRGRATRENGAPDLSGTEQALQSDAVSAGRQGDINAMASSIPGVTPITNADGDPAGFSVLGLSSDQNSTTLNGASFGASSVPRDAAVVSSLVTTPYDVSRGGFSGAQFNLRSGGGSNYIRRTSSLNVDAPSLQWTDAAARALGQQYTNLSLGGLLSGPIAFDKAFYNVSYQLGRRSNDLRSLLNTDAAGLQATGVAADSVARLVAIAAAQHIPLTAGRSLNDRLNDQGSLFGTLDFAPPGSNTGTTYNVTLNGNWNRQTPAASLSAELPAHGADRTSWGGGAQGRHTSYVKNVILSETTLGVNGSRSYGTPYLTLPNGSVLVNSLFADGTSSVRTLAFGGNGALGTSSGTLTVEAMNQLSWFSKNNKHRLKLASELRRDAYDQDQTTNAYGSFGYNSLADLAGNRPASYSRTLLPRVQSASEIVAALSLGDSYRRSSDLQIQYGVRLDANRFSAEPAYNADIDRIFAARNDVTPNRVYVSPRIGFSYSYGTAPQIAGFDGAVRGPRAVVRGGVGVFQSTPNANLIGGAIDNTGLASAVQQLSCVGPAVPTPDWSAYAASSGAIPVQCADGSSGSVFASNSPNATLFARDFASPRSIRSNINWSGPLAGNRFNGSIDLTYSMNLNQSSAFDLNFEPATRFTLASEGGRPVYVQPSSIVAATGAIASRDARVSQRFNRVSELRSDLRSETKQLRVGIFPASFTQKLSWSLNYTLAGVREQYRGFQSTAGDPRDIAWSRGGAESRHAVSYSIGYNFLDAVRINWFGQFRSGSPFTPTIAGDVNGDGYANDRAFVFDPASSSDPDVASAMRTLLQNGSGPAKECLLSQLGTVASRNSCTGPWTSSANLSISFNPLKVRLPQRATLSFSVSNPLGAADLLLHGESRLHGWGQFTFVDPTLMYVRGFDSTARRYEYEINPRFGSTNPQFNAFRAPVTLTMQLRVDVGPTRERQQLTQQLDRGRKTQGQKAPEFLLRAMYGSGGLVNPMAQMLRQSDTLELTGPQADSLASMNRAYTVSLDSIWMPLTKYLANLPQRYDQDAVYARYTAARKASVDQLIALAPAVNALLTDAQRRMLPALVASHLDVRYLAGVRSGTAGGSAGGAFGGGFIGGGGGPGVFVGGGGGGERIIIRN
ncbi:MAG TPA: carboxypeptidase-like regulatory domain-containing protein [Gemmatimonadaceae bacterium]|nr:carboxypeptidase-like regulatory domain-containing protein [Gemmatimonadaceae bacterium]